MHEINLHLQGIRKYVKAMDIVNFLDTPEMRTQLNWTTPIHQTTAQRWMQKLGYCWANMPKGQYVNGHEHEDIVAYQQNYFLPELAKIEAKMKIWMEGGIEPEDPNAATTLDICYTVVWYHDESVFYVNDWQMIQ